MCIGLSNDPITLFAPRDTHRYPGALSYHPSYPDWCRRGRGYKRVQTGTPPQVIFIAVHWSVPPDQLHLQDFSGGRRCRQDGSLRSLSCGLPPPKVGARSLSPIPSTYTYPICLQWSYLAERASVPTKQTKAYNRVLLYSTWKKQTTI